jgi:predicted transcriptional regulator
MPDGRGNAARQRILEFIQGHPGTSAREVQRSLGIGWGEAAYHLARLARDGAVSRWRGGRRDYYFGPGWSEDDRRVLIAMQSPTERWILVELARRPGQTFVELDTRIPVSKSTLAFHLKFLLVAGSVVVEPLGGMRRYYSRRPDRVLELFQRYRESWSDRLVDRFASVFGGLVRD